MHDKLTADRFVEQLEAHRSAEELAEIQRYFKSGKGEYGEGEQFMGVRMGTVFEVAKAFIDMTPAEIEKLLESPVHEVRAGGASVMDKQGRRNKTPEERRKALYDLYLRRHDRINNWDLVDLAAPFVVGRYLYDKPRDVLYELASSQNLWERRTAIVATAYFIRQGDTADTFRIAELLVNDSEDMVQKPVGGWLRAAGGTDPVALLAFLDRHAATMPRTALRYALEHLDAEQRTRYMAMKQASVPPPAAATAGKALDNDLQGYIDAIDPAFRPLFDRLHRLILEVRPDVDAGLSYDLPAFKAGRRRLYVGVWQHGVSLYGWSGDRDAGFTSRHPHLTSGRGTIRLRPEDAEAIGDDEFRDLIRAVLAE